VKRLKTKEDVFGATLRETFHLEYTRLRIFNHDHILPLIGVIVEPQIHTIGIYMKLGSLYHVLHDMDSGKWMYIHVFVIILHPLSSYQR